LIESNREEDEQVDDQRHEYLKVPEVAEVLRIARSRAYELVGEGEIPSVRIGRSVRVSRKELERWLEEQRQPSARWR
jgi:excisionase family DNA binding protein